MLIFARLERDPNSRLIGVAKHVHRFSDRQGTREKRARAHTFTRGHTFRPPYFHTACHPIGLASVRSRSFEQRTVSRSFSHSVRRSPSYVRGRVRTVPVRFCLVSDRNRSFSTRLLSSKCVRSIHSSASFRWQFRSCYFTNITRH